MHSVRDSSGKKSPLTPHQFKKWAVNDPWLEYPARDDILTSYMAPRIIPRMAHQVVIDTNVLVAGLRSRHGASNKLLSLVDMGLFELHLSVPLVLEYEDVLSRPTLGLSKQDQSAFIDYLCAIGTHHQIHFLWRPFLKDPKDDFVLEVAVVSRSNFIITFNIQDFESSDLFGIVPIPPAPFLELIGAIP